MGTYIKGGNPVTPIDTDGNIIGSSAAPIVTTSSTTSAVNAANSSAVALAGGAAFTGTAVDISGYGSVTVSVFANQASAANGFQIQQSVDATNWDFVDQYTVAASASVTVNSPRQAQWMRVVYTNGATPNTIFRLTTMLNSAMPVASAQRPADAMSIQNDFPIGMSLQTVYNGTTLDLQRGMINAANSVGTGLLAAGILAQLDDTSPTTITENSFGNLRMAPNRALLTMPYASTAENWAYAAAASGIVNTTTAVTIKAAAAAGFRNYIKSIDIATTGALGAATELVIRDGAAGTVIYRTIIPTTGIPSGRAIVFDPPLRGTAATLMEVATLTASVTGGVYVNASGFIAP